MANPKSKRGRNGYSPKIRHAREREARQSSKRRPGSHMFDNINQVFKDTSNQLH